MKLWTLFVSSKQLAHNLFGKWSASLIWKCMQNFSRQWGDFVHFSSLFTYGYWNAAADFLQQCSTIFVGFFIKYATEFLHCLFATKSTQSVEHFRCAFEYIDGKAINCNFNSLQTTRKQLMYTLCQTKIQFDVRSQFLGQTISNGEFLCVPIPIARLTKKSRVKTVSFILVQKSSPVFYSFHNSLDLKLLQFRRIHWILNFTMFFLVFRLEL